MPEKYQQQQRIGKHKQKKSNVKKKNTTKALLRTFDINYYLLSI